MRMILLGLLFISPNVHAAKDYSAILSASAAFACALARGEVRCFWNDGSGNDLTELSKSQVLKNPSKVIAHDSDICAIDDDGLKCWGGPHFRRVDNSKIPKLVNPRAFTGFTYRQACALDDTGIVCWTKDGEIVKTPAFKNPRAVVASESDLCALDDVGVQCWGRNGPQLKVPYLKNPRELAASYNNICAIDDVGIHCFYDNGIKEPIVGLKNPHMLAVGDDHVCAVVDDGVQCWVLGWNQGQADVPPLKNPKALVAGRFYTCALDDLGVHCWGIMGPGRRIEKGKTPNILFWPTVANPGFYPNEIPQFLSIASTVSSSARRSLFLNLSAYAESEINEIKVISPSDLDAANFLLVSLVGPAIQMGDSDYFVKTLIPAYNLSLQRFSSKTGISNMEAIPPTELNNRIALKIIHESLKLMKEFVSSSDQIEIEKIILLVGKAMASPKQQSVLELTTALKNQTAILNKISALPKTAFLVSTVNTAANWLESKQ
jgi:hypothetical protein